jgi:polar amino acid transport system permease protein
MIVAAFEWHIFWNRIFHPDHVFAQALWRTVYIAVAAQFFGVVLGLISALMRMSRFRLLRILGGLYVLLIRGTPVIVQIFFIYFGANLFLGFDLFPRTVGLGAFSLSGAVVAGIVALGVNEGAYMSEIVRAGILSIDPGQMEAAKSLGMTFGKAMRRIVLPQAMRVIVPPLGNEFNNMLKTTSLLAFIGVYELFLDADIHYSSTFKPTEYFAAVAFWYLMLTVVWSVIQAWIEGRLAASERGDQLSFVERMRDAWAPVPGRLWGREAQ